MKFFIVAVILVLFGRELLKMVWAIKTNAKPIRIIASCVSACVIAVFAKFVGDLLTMV